MSGEVELPDRCLDVICVCMNVSLTPKLERFIGRKVKSGRYRSPSQVICEGLRLLESEELLHEERMAEVRRKIAIGLEQLDRGEGIPGEVAYARMKRKSQAFRRARR